jgi:catechol 2,3-dioxygenase-like lactoylglutathione lyase family enzyme
MQINRIDHLVLTVASIERSVEFYSRVLGMEKIEFGAGRIALGFGRHKINLHQCGQEFQPNAENAVAGSADLCFILETPLPEAIEQLRQRGIDVIEGPAERSGATGGIVSAYLRDPDGNLLELSNYVDD